MWKKCCRAGQAIDNNMAHAHCMLDSSGCQHTISSRHYFSTATVVARTRLKVTLFVHRLCWFCITGPLRVQFFCLAFGVTALCFLDADTVLIWAKEIIGMSVVNTER